MNSPKNMEPGSLIAQAGAESIKAEASHPLNILQKQLLWTQQENDRSCNHEPQTDKLQRLLEAACKPPKRNQSLIKALNDYWRWFLYWSPGSEYSRKKAGAINRFGGFINDGFVSAVTRTAQIHLAKVSAVMTDVVSMTLWLEANQAPGDYNQAAIEKIATAGVDYYHQTNPKLEYYGRLGDDEDFIDTDMGVRLGVIADNIRTDHSNNDHQPQSVDLSQLAVEAAVHSFCAQITYSRRKRHAALVYGS